MGGARGGKPATRYTCGMNRPESPTAASRSGPLAGLRVLEMGALIAGPFCAKLLGELGAEVVKIEPPGQGDPLRKWRYMKDGVSVWWHVQSRNKRSVAVDLRRPEGQAIARELDPTLGGFGAIEYLGPDGLVPDESHRRVYFGDDISLDEPDAHS